MASSAPAMATLRQCLNDSLVPSLGSPQCAQRVPLTSQDARDRSLNDLPIEISQLSSRTSSESLAEDTVLYLGYGSNLSAETFQGKRNVKPISQVNVVVPALSLSFDLPGLPYVEPCFGNVRYRDGPGSKEGTRAGYHKDRWHKGLVGVVYEVTRADYINIIATEGGGSGYQDVLVDCYSLTGRLDESVPLNPLGPHFKAHTLYNGEALSRRVHSYAQPSPRYLKLITDGAAEHDLPREYQDYLNQIRTFHITTVRQRLGLFVFLTIWAPALLFIFSTSKIFLRSDGTYPKWVAKFIQAIFTSFWKSYDHFFKRLFGDGERTIGDVEESMVENALDETAPLLGKN